LGQFESRSKITPSPMPVLSGGSANVAFLSTGSGGLKIADTMALPQRFHEHRSPW